METRDMALGLGRIQRIDRAVRNLVAGRELCEGADLGREDCAANRTGVEAARAGWDRQPAGPSDEPAEQIGNSVAAAASPESPQASLERVSATIIHDPCNLDAGYR